MGSLNASASSLPPRERGLKQRVGKETAKAGVVAPPAGAWIETIVMSNGQNYYQVAPPAGAWIETDKIKELEVNLRSLPPRERGLKHNKHCKPICKIVVAPPAGAWIETCHPWPDTAMLPRRSPRGSVD